MGNNYNMSYMEILKFADEEDVNGLLHNDETVIRHFFSNVVRLCLPILSRVFFDYKVDKEGLVNGLYLHLRENDWYKLRQFDYRSKLTKWFLVVAVRFFQKKEKR